MTDNDLKRLEDLLLTRLTAIENTQAEITANVKALEIGQAEII